MRPGSPVKTYASFAGFTPQTQYLVDEQFARDAFEGQAMAVGSTYGRGVLYLYSTHFEHPDYPQANLAVANTVFHAASGRNHGVPETSNRLSTAESKALARELYSAASNLRVLSSGMEASQVFWQIGQKVWEPEKARYFAEAIWECAREIRAGAVNGLPADETSGLKPACRDALETVRKVRKIVGNGGNSLTAAREMFFTLNRLAEQAYRVRYRNKLESLINENNTKVDNPGKAKQHA
jgi:hypothetical protein